MLSYNYIKTIAKGKGFRIQDIAKEVNYSYTGFLKAMKQGSLDFDARIKLSELLDIPLSEFQTNHEQSTSKFEEPKGNYRKNITLTEVYEDEIKVLKEQILQKDATIDRLLRIIEKMKNLEK